MFNYLPDEIILNILNVADTMSCLCLTMTCKRINKIRTNRCISKNIPLEIILLYIDSDNKRYIQKYKDNIRINILNTLQTIVSNIHILVNKHDSRYDIYLGYYNIYITSVSPVGNTLSIEYNDKQFTLVLKRGKVTKYRPLNGNIEIGFIGENMWKYLDNAKIH